MMSGAIMNKIWGAFGMDAEENEEEEYEEIEETKKKITIEKINFGEDVIKL